MAIRKTPDVYVEEISIFPPSVAEVETAIPAFIGHTEKAMKISTDDLLNKPTRISSLLDYEKYFGTGPAIDVDNISLDDSNNFISADINSKYFLYDSLRLFYGNGGGDCYIVSVGDYDDSIEYSTLKAGLDTLEKYDEPTIILFPDAVSLDGVQLYTLQADTMSQCGKLMDRVGVFDLKKFSDTATADYESTDPTQDFRDNVGINNLKYGMAYTPWLKVSLTKNITYRNVRDKIEKYGTAVTLNALTTDTDLLQIITDYNNIIADDVTITDDLKALFGADTTFRQKYDQLAAAFGGDPTNVAKFSAIIDLLMDLAGKVDDWAGGDVTDSTLNALVKSTISSTFDAAYESLRQHDNECKEATKGIAGYTTLYVAGNHTASEWVLTKAATGNQDVFGDSDLPEVKMAKMLVKLKTIFETINKGLTSILDSVYASEITKEKALLDSSPLYKTIITSLNDSSTIMPPSGAVVGVYAAVDRERGVWKAPANVSLNGVVGPTDIFTASELEDLNIDVNAGKSVNAIRAFTGKGTLIWGARTLAGNDNEWRYIPVRRFYNTVEESIKKSTYWAVFEPNNANTWVKVKGMIENYLTLKWREGALVGAKPDDAFFVRIGLGVTMTAQDILNGYMNVEIGMAVVRPAEFIVLKFSHKLQQS